MHQYRGDFRAVGEQQQPLGREVQPSDGNEMPELFIERIVDDAPSPRVVLGNELAAGLVVDDDRDLVVGDDFFAADIDLVTSRFDPDGGIGFDLAVDADIAVLDGAVGLAARIGGVVGDVFVQAHQAIPFSTRSCR